MPDPPPPPRSPQFCLPPCWRNPSITGLPQCAGTCQSQKGPQPQTDGKALTALGPLRDCHAGDALSGSAGVRKPFLPTTTSFFPPLDSNGPPRLPSFPWSPEFSPTLGQGSLFASSSFPQLRFLQRRLTLPLCCLKFSLPFVCYPDPAQPRVGQQHSTQSARVLPPGKLDRDGGG